MIALTWVIDVPLNSDMDAIRATADSTGEALEASAGLLAGVTAVSVAGVDDYVRNSVAILDTSPVINWPGLICKGAKVFASLVAPPERIISTKRGSASRLLTMLRRNALLKSRSATRSDDE